MCLLYIITAVVVIIAIYIIYNKHYNLSDSKEGFHPRGWWWGPGGRWGWRRNWTHPWGNWRPYGYYPAYSGYWKQCADGHWIPQTMSCNL